MATQSKVRWTIKLRYVLLAVVLTHSSALAQNALDATTPPGHAPGAPAGSYSLSGFENVNLFNGHLNFHLPLTQAKGRGEAGFVSTLAIEQRWTVDHDSFSGARFPQYNWWTGLRPGYGPGVLQGRQMSEGCNEGFDLTQGTTRLTFTTSDGTEYMLFDQIYFGQVASSYCDPYNPSAPGTSRGTVFATNDGTATFVSDTAIHDHNYTPSGPKIITPAGYLTLRDGTRFRIDNGLVTWMRDKNGNKLSFTYEGSWQSWRITSATDSLNRQVIYQYNFSDPTYGICDRVIFKGISGAQRIIRIVRTSLSNALISGESLATYYSLFPNLNGSNSTYHNTDVVSAVWLPDGRSYQLRYNRYGELCRVDLPTGGRFEYSWFEFAQGEIDRRVAERRSYLESGALASRSVYGGYVSSNQTQGTVQSDHLDFSGALIAREKHYFHGHPFSYVAWQFELPDPIQGREYRTEQFASDGTTILRRLDQDWVSCGGLCITQTVATLEPSTANLVSKQAFTYGSYLNRTDVYEYGFGAGTPGTLVRRTHIDYLTTNPVNGVDYATSSISLRSLPTKEQMFDGAGVERARTTYEYDNYTSDSNHAGLVNRANISGLDAGFTTFYGTRGNVTGITRYLFNTSGSVTGSVSAYQQYDIAGNVVKAIDARGYVTDFDFSDRFGTADANAQANSGAAELGAQVSYALATKVTNPLSHISYCQFDYYSGHPVDTEDPNGVVTSLYYNDSLDRLTQIRRAVGADASNQTTFSYDDVSRIITTTNDLFGFGDNVLTSKTLYDGLGRTTETRQYEGGSNYIVTQTQYDSLNRPFKLSNPSRPWQSESAVWTTQVFDALGRVILVTTPDNAVVSTVYSGNSVTVTDAAGKVRKSVSDAFGRLIEVHEDPSGVNYLTTYTYNTLDNLVKVTQGSQQRFFLYDSLNRLQRARNPEQATLAGLNLSDPLTGNGAWSIGYQYDANNNLTQKTDARGVVSTYVYDALNRNTTVDYSDTSSINPDVKRFYDGATNGKGRFWHHYTGGDFSTGSNVEHTAIDSYDALGRPLVQRQLFKLNGTWSGTYQTSRAYNRAGGVTSQTYPSGHFVTYNYNNAGRLADKDAQNLAFSGNLGDGVLRTYASGNTYSSWGSLSMERFGTATALYHKLQYNIRGQLWDVRVATGSDVNGSWNRGALQMFYESTYTHGASGPDNNGNVLKTNHYVPLDESSSTWAIHDQFYNYDGLNRLTSVAEYFISNSQPLTQQSLQSYTYDRWGNRTINAGQTWGAGINAKQFTVDTTTNRLGVPGGQPGVMTYDNAGNLTTDSYSGAGTRTYDAENRMTTAADNTGQTSRYTYDADGSRTRRQVAGGQEQWQIYGFDGELLAEYPVNGSATSPQKEYGYRNGQLLVTASPALSPNHSLSLNGSSGYVQAPNSSSLNISGSITLEAWIKLNSIGAYQEIITRETYGQSGTGGGYGLTVTNLGKPRIDLYHTPTTYTPVIGSTSMSTGVWYHVAGVWDGSYLRIYLNGVLDGSTTTGNGPGSGTSSVNIGRNSGGSYFNGLIDEVRVSNAAVYSSNFTPQTHLTASGSTQGLWKFDGQTTADSSPNGNNGTLQGGATYADDVPSGDGGGGSGSGSVPQILWLVPDHLGTPRIVVDHTGSRENVKRHDYLPFGEELFAGTGGRTPALGYAGDGVRQQFTSKERDVETGLDYFLARYYSTMQGRFTSPDEFKGGPHELRVLGSGDAEKQALVYADVTNPQSLNKYQYTLNNPLRYIDPDGKAPQDSFHNRMDHLIRQQLKGEITEKQYREALRGPAAGTAGALAVIILARGGNVVLNALGIWAVRNPDKVQQIAQGLQEAAGGLPTLVLGPASRLTSAEISTGQRLAQQLGVRLEESVHVGAEFVVSGTNKTIDAMGGANAYQHFGDGKKFFESIVHHVNKSIDYVAIDFKGALESQKKAIQNFVGGLTREQQEKIIYVKD